MRSSRPILVSDPQDEQATVKQPRSSSKAGAGAQASSLTHPGAVPHSGWGPEGASAGVPENSARFPSDRRRDSVDWLGAGSDVTGGCQNSARLPSGSDGRRRADDAVSAGGSPPDPSPEQLASGNRCLPESLRL